VPTICIAYTEQILQSSILYPPSAILTCPTTQEYPPTTIINPTVSESITVFLLPFILGFIAGGLSFGGLILLKLKVKNFRRKNIIYK
jgi:hypothetical protein